MVVADELQAQLRKIREKMVEADRATDDELWLQLLREERETLLALHRVKQDG